MAERESVHPNCVNASNPFHRCVEDCYLKIATSKARKSKSFQDAKTWLFLCPSCPKTDGGRRFFSLVRNKWPFRSMISEVEASMNVISAEKDVVIRYNVGTDGYQKSGRRTTRGSSFNKPVDAPEKATIHSIPIASALSTPSNSTTPKSKLESTNPVSSSVPFSGENHVEDFSFTKGQLGTSRFTITSELLFPALCLSPDRPVKASSSSGTPITSSEPPKETESNQCHIPPEVVSSIPVSGVEGGTQHIGLHDHSLSFTISDRDRPSEDSCEEDVHSVALDSRVSVGKYYVKESVSSTLRAIFDKYGDIAESCRMESLAMRSYCLECVCLVVHDLRSSSTTQLTESKLQEMSAVLKDLESSQIKVDWLRQVLEGLSKSGELITHRDAIMVEKVKCDRVFETTKKKLQLHLEDLAEKEQAVVDAKAQVAETEHRLRQIELDSSKLEESIVSLQSQIEGHSFSSLLDELV